MYIKKSYDYREADVHNRRCGDNPCCKVRASEANFPLALREN